MKPHIARERWEGLIEEIIFKPERINAIDLNDSYIGYIPTDIIDLNKVVLLSSASACSSGTGGSLTTRPLLNQHSARASTMSDVIGKLSAKGAWAGRTGSLDRLETSSFTTYPEGAKRSDFLWLVRLTVLILRSNKLTHIPAQIKNPKDLQELDVSVNKLQYLPAEMLQMQLLTLNNNVNSLRNTSLTFVPLATRAKISKPELADKSVIPLLNERCFRVLRTYCQIRSRTYG